MSVTAARGFVASGIHCGIKPTGDPDLALVATDDGRAVPTAAVFTSNKFTAAPVLVSAEHLTATGGRAAAVVLNAGNANAATGDAGRTDASTMTSDTAAQLGCAPDEVLVCSTGLIGIPLPIDTIRAGIPDLATRRSRDGAADAAEAIRTTDTHAKQAVAAVEGTDATVGGMAKGAAMLAPDMATMLAVVTTDAAVDADTARTMLRAATDRSFNILMTDACRSTNDTVVLMASGEAGPVPDAALQTALDAVCEDLARQMCGDAEGATKVVELTVTGAATGADAEAAARTIARSALCKCSWYGRDPYWGRIASEAGSADIDFDQSRVSVSYGGIVVARGGITVDHDTAAVAAHMAERHLDIRLDLGLGDGSFTVLTNDLTHDYIDENTGGS